MLTPANINTPEYWDGVYLREWESGQAHGAHYHRDYAPIHDAILRLIPSGSEVLDIACGAGLLCRKIARQVPSSRVMGVDFSEFMIGRNEEIDKALPVEYRCLDIRTSLASLGRQFDVVCMCEVLEHLAEPEAVLGDAVALVREGGQFILTCPHDNSIPDPEHVRTWGHDELFHLLARYSDAITFRHFPAPYYHHWMLAHFAKAGAAGQPGGSQ
ncbi:MAG TPA: methyltransferase domain-containing protein [Verrucomicrobiae bacterium]